MTKLLIVLILSLSGVVTVVVFAPPGWGGGPGHMQAPEIDPASAVTALTLLMGSVAVLRSRFARK
jgi:hypothetical protein